MGFRIDWNAGKFITAVGKESEKDLEAVAEYIASRMRTRAPVKTGTLRDSIEVRKINSGSMIGFNIGAQMSGSYDRYYASFVELGTSDTKSQPFMRPALYDDGVKKLKKAFNAK